MKRFLLISITYILQTNTIGTASKQHTPHAKKIPSAPSRPIPPRLGFKTPPIKPSLPIKKTPAPMLECNRFINIEDPLSCQNCIFINQSCKCKLIPCNFIVL